MFGFEKVSHISYKPVLNIVRRLEYKVLREEIAFFHHYHEYIFASPQIFLKDKIKHIFWRISHPIKKKNPILEKKLLIENK